MAVVARGISLTVKHRTSVGGRNLLKQSMVKCYNGISSNEALSTSDYPTNGHITYNRDTSANLGFYIDNKTVMTPGEQYVVTARIKCASGTINHLYIFDGLGNGTSIGDQKSSVYWNGTRLGTIQADLTIPTMTVGTWYNLRLEFTCPATFTTNYDGHILQFNKSGNQAFAIEIDGLKFEHGNTPTDWTPAPEDKANQAILDQWSSQSETDVLNAVQNGFTTINGGFIQTSTIKADHLYIDQDLRSKVIEAINIKSQEVDAVKINADALDVRGMTVHNAQNVETLRVTSEGDITLRGDLESYNFNDGKTGWAIKRNGNAEFNDVTVRGSVITNDGGVASSGGAGRNLFRESGFWSSLPDTAYIGDNGGGRVLDTAVTYQGYPTIRTTVGGGLNFHYGFVAVDTSKIYTYTAMVRSQTADNGAQTSPLHYHCYSADKSSSVGIEILSYQQKIPVANEWTKLQIVFKPKGPWFRGFLYFGTSKSLVMNLAWVKLEEGNIATDWSPAPEDNFKQVRFWAGASYEERENAPFIVYNDGSIKATKGNYSGLWTGDIQVGNISISDTSATAGNDALLKIQHGSSGIVAVELTDKDESIFRQDLSIRSSTNVEMISLSREGSGIFNSQVQVGTGANSSQLQSDRLNLRGRTLGIYSDGFQFENNVNVGSASNMANLTSYGVVNAKSDIILDGALLFGSVVKFARVTGGLNIDVL